MLNSPCANLVLVDVSTSVLYVVMKVVIDVQLRLAPQVPAVKGKVSSASERKVASTRILDVV